MVPPTLAHLWICCVFHSPQKLGCTVARDASFCRISQVHLVLALIIEYFMFTPERSVMNFTHKHKHTIPTYIEMCKMCMYIE